jgi:hypothetical protein
LFLAVESLSKAYTRELDIKNIILPSDSLLQERIEHDLLLIGGPNHNRVTAQYLEETDDEKPFQLTQNAIIWRCKKMAGKWIDDDAIEYTSKVDNKKIIQDFGIVARVQNPFTNNKRTVILLSGIHTYGTIAAAKFFTEDMQKGWRWFFRLRKRNIVALVRTRIIDDYTANIQLVKYASW